VTILATRISGEKVGNETCTFSLTVFVMNIFMLYFFTMGLTFITSRLENLVAANVASYFYKLAEVKYRIYLLRAFVRVHACECGITHTCVYRYTCSLEEIILLLYPSYDIY